MTRLLLAFALLSAAGLSVAVPANGLSQPQKANPGAAKPGNGTAVPAPAAPPAPATGNNPAPAPATGNGGNKPVNGGNQPANGGNQASIGIDLDVIAQQGQLAATNDLITLLKATATPNIVLYNAARVCYLCKVFES
jgi:hypothetical protein